MPSSLRFFTVGLLAILAAIVVPDRAFATHIDDIVPTANYDHACKEGSVYGGGTVCQTDNANVYYYYLSSGSLGLEYEDINVLLNMIVDEYQPTDLAFHFDSTPKYTGSGETDIIYQEGNVPGSDNGITWCNDDSLGPC